MANRTFKFSSDSWTASLSSIFKTNIHTDVYFECEGKKIAVHRTVLASQSVFLREILKHSEPSIETPVLYLEGFRYDIVLLLVSFLYNGRVEGSSDDLVALSKYGKELRIDGLVNSGRTTQPLQLEVLEQKKKQVNKQLSILQETESDSEVPDTSDDEELMIVFEKNKSGYNQDAHTPSKRKKKEKQRSHIGSTPQIAITSEATKRSISPTSESGTSTAKKKCLKVAQTVEKSTGPSEPHKFRCRTCREVFTEKEDFKKHLAEKHADILTCSICGKLLAARSTLKTHLKNHITKLDSLLNAPLIGCPIAEAPVNASSEIVK